ncbi:MAG TPA: PAS domain S-box protein [Selenomonadales bacterium]|nr:PAS domain S-box protein [Selenomonadales bacterium]
MESPAKKHPPPSDIAVPRSLFSPSDFAVFEQVDAGIFLHHPHTGAIATLNQQACELYGYSPDDMRRFNISVLHPGEYPYTAEEALRRFKEAAAGHAQLFEWKTKNKNGRDLWVEVNLKAVTVGDREYILAMVRDISRRKLAEQRLLLQRSYFALLQEAAPAIMKQTDYLETLKTLITRSCSLVGASHGFIYLADDTQNVLKLEATVALPSGALSPEIAAGAGPVGKTWCTSEPVIVSSPRSLTGETGNSPDQFGVLICIPLKNNSQVLGVLGLCSSELDQQPSEDEVNLLLRFAELATVALENSRLYRTMRTELTESKDAETALKLSENLYRKLFNSVHDAIYVMEITPEGMPGNIVEANEAACRKLGYTRDELLRLTSADIVPLEFRGDVREKIELLYAQNHVLTESAYITKEGVTIPVEVTTHLFYLDSHPCAVVIARDIAERKRVEKEIARLDRLSLIGAMAAGIGHEIRNPLTTVRGFLQVLNSKDDYAKHKNYFDLMIQELDRANSIITELLSLAKNKAVDLRPGNLNSIISILLPLLEAGAILYNKTVKTELADIPDIPLDEKEIRQLILNLVRNGLDAMPPGGVLTITTTCLDNEIVLSVKDQGKGIPLDLTEKIGTPFFTTKEYGVGLGLAVCYSIAARHNAAVRFESDSSGTIFFVHFRMHA